MSSSLRLHLQGPVVRLELFGADGYPRLSTSLLVELDAHLDRVFALKSCKGIVIHGSEKCFAAGAEMGEIQALTGITALPFARRGQLLCEKITHAPKPLVAAVAGYCLGGGFDLALACRWRLATPAAVFGHPGATRGLLTGWGGTQRLPQLIGRTRALELLLKGTPLDAAHAWRLGIVDELVPPEKLLLRACERAQGQGSPQSKPAADLTPKG